MINQVTLMGIIDSMPAYAADGSFCYARLRVGADWHRVRALDRKTVVGLQACRPDDEVLVTGRLARTGRVIEVVLTDLQAISTAGRQRWWTGRRRYRRGGAGQ